MDDEWWDMRRGFDLEILRLSVRVMLEEEKWIV